MQVKKIFRWMTRCVLGSLILVAFMSSWHSASVAHAAATLIVNTVSDADSALDGVCSLREAIIAANLNANYHECVSANYGADVIRFSVNGTITLGATLPDITDEVMIDGTGQNISISGNHLYRVLNVPINKTLGLVALTIIRGKGATCNGFTCGGAIYNHGTLKVTRSTFSENAAAEGGAIFNYYGALDVSITVFDNNSAVYGAACIENVSGTVNVSHSTFHQNTANNGYGCISSTGTLNLFKSTFDGNSGFYNGGVINYGSTVNVSNTTFSGNFTATGGGVYNSGGAIRNAGGTANISNSTFSGNSANYGGALFNDGGVLNIKNTILTHTAQGGTCLDTGTLNGSNNLIDDTTCGANAGRVGSVTAFDTHLRNHGGVTQTHALSPQSNALDAVTDCTYISSGTNPLFNNGATITADQRGVMRPQNALCDIGAFELTRATAVDVTGPDAKWNQQSVRVSWRTASESDIAGFDVWRKDDKHAWKQINAQFIQAKHAGAVQGAAYRFQDKNAKKSNTYRYKIQVMYLDGHTEWTRRIQVTTP